jgi:fatty acid desaturase (delta-4 desaturase)
MNGGLNYQIEHHLFPRMHHGHYATVAPVVRAFCLERGIPYHHFPTLLDNVKACVTHLFDLGTNDVPKSAMHIAELSKTAAKTAAM